MATTAQLKSELDKNENDKRINEIQLELARESMAGEFVGMNKRSLSLKPKTYKLPFKLRFKNAWADFKQHLAHFLGY